MNQAFKIYIALMVGIVVGLGLGDWLELLLSKLRFMKRFIIPWKFLQHRLKPLKDLFERLTVGMLAFRTFSRIQMVAQSHLGIAML